MTAARKIVHEPIARPILFSGPMVRAILEGRKTQTRRIVNPQPSAYVPSANRHPAKRAAAYFDSYCSEPKTPANPRGMSDRWCWWSPDERQGPDWIRCPYGVPGDLLWVRETWGRVTGNGVRVVYRADGERPERIGYPGDPITDMRWVPSIHMPRALSRITLRVTDVRVERLQDISEADARAEGCVARTFRDGRGHEPATLEFRRLWEAINGKRAPWASNPWVWRVAFEVVR